jgi:hypothetical protein
VKWWKEPNFWLLAIIIYLMFLGQLPEGRKIEKMLPLLIVVAVIAWLIWKGWK